MSSVRSFGRFWIMLTIVSTTAILPGCGSDGPPLGSVSGTVTLDGEPVPNAFVVFTPEGAGRPSQTKTDASGEFTLSFTGSEGGALIGTHQVTVSTEDIPDEGEPVPERIPAKYNTEGSISVTVKDGPNDIPLELTSQ